MFAHSAGRQLFRNQIGKIAEYSGVAREHPWPVVIALAAKNTGGNDPVCDFLP